MNKIGIYNLEPKYANIALEKIIMYYIEKGYQVEKYFALAHNSYDKIYCSSIFDFTDKRYVTKDMICGGSGFDLITKLPERFDRLKPKINIGFTSRGCNRKCEFCIVHKKEGRFKIVGDIYDFWDGVTQVIYILDNNILFNKKHFIKICKQVNKENIKVSFSQGLDLKLVDGNILRWLSEIKHYKKIKFAFDNYEDMNLIINQLAMVVGFIKASKIMVYVLCGFNTSFKQDMERIKILKAMEIDPFIMLYHKKSKLLNELARWNNRFYFRNITFEDYLSHRKYYYLLKELNGGK